jgi:hypothetical protein
MENKKVARFDGGDGFTFQTIEPDLATALVGDLTHEGWLSIKDDQMDELETTLDDSIDGLVAVKTRLNVIRELDAADVPRPEYWANRVDSEYVPA